MLNFALGSLKSSHVTTSISKLVFVMWNIIIYFNIYHLIVCLVYLCCSYMLTQGYPSVLTNFVVTWRFYVSIIDVAWWHIRYSWHSWYLPYLRYLNVLSFSELDDTNGSEYLSISNIKCLTCHTTSSCHDLSLLLIYTP